MHNSLKTLMSPQYVYMQEYICTAPSKLVVVINVGTMFRASVYFTVKNGFFKDIRWNR